MKNLFYVDKQNKLVTEEEKYYIPNLYWFTVISFNLSVKVRNMLKNL